LDVLRRALSRQKELRVWMARFIPVHFTAFPGKNPFCHGGKPIEGMHWWISRRHGSRREMTAGLVGGASGKNPPCVPQRE